MIVVSEAEWQFVHQLFHEN